ncbi:uncharacterized protein [Epargyreus clarus]|uniref:uncharacterized protein n=1 Tax=Epargyreus clarus TaxID=520877 RepID=UPI003C30813C
MSNIGHELASKLNKKRNSDDSGSFTSTPQSHSMALILTDIQEVGSILMGLKERFDGRDGPANAGGRGTYRITARPQFRVKLAARGGRAVAVRSVAPEIVFGRGRAPSEAAPQSPCGRARAPASRPSRRLCLHARPVDGTRERARTAPRCAYFGREEAPGRVGRAARALAAVLWWWCVALLRLVALCAPPPGPSGVGAPPPPSARAAEDAPSAPSCASAPSNTTEPPPPPAADPPAYAGWWWWAGACVGGAVLLCAAGALARPHLRRRHAAAAAAAANPIILKKLIRLACFQIVFKHSFFYDI